MRQIQILLVFLCLIVAGPLASAQSGKVLKVLPQHMDLRGQTSLSPSLYDRDAYQAILRRDARKCSGLAFNVNWKAHSVDAAKLKLRVEARGVIGDVIQRQTFEQSVEKPGFFSRWTVFKVTGEDYQKLGNLIAWRVTLWEGDRQLSEQKSFLW